MSRCSARASPSCREREFFIDNLLVQIHFIIVMIRWTGLAPWKVGFPFPGSQLQGSQEMPQDPHGGVRPFHPKVEGADRQREREREREREG